MRLRQRPRKGDVCFTPYTRGHLRGKVTSARSRKTVEVQWFLPDGRPGGKCQEQRTQFLRRPDHWIVCLA